MERMARFSPTLVVAFVESLERLKHRFFGPHPPRDPDPEELFSDAVERAMMMRELHCR